MKGKANDSCKYTNMARANTRFTFSKFPQKIPFCQELSPDPQFLCGTNSYNLVFINACASADLGEYSNMPVKYADAFDAQNSVGWPTPVVALSAAAAAEKFFEKLEGKGQTITKAVDKITATQFLGPRTIGYEGLIKPRAEEKPLTIVREKKNPHVIIYKK